MQSVKLFIPGDPKPMQRPRAMFHKRTHKPILYVPQPTLAYQQLVRTAAMQPGNFQTLKKFLSSDPYGRMVVDIKLTFCRFRHPDIVNVRTNIYDGLVKAIGGNDKNYIGKDIPPEVNTGLAEGMAEIEIRPFVNAETLLEVPVI